MNYKQFILKRKDGRQYTWIPKKYAKPGMILDLKEGKVWNKGWEVVMVGELELTERQCILNSQDYKRTREATDI